MRVFVTGATGFIGRALCAALQARGDSVVTLSRSGKAPPGCEAVTGDPTHAGLWQSQVARCDGVVHLAGESVADGRLDAAHKDRVMKSRVSGTRSVVEAIAMAAPAVRPRVLVCASGIDYYPFDEGDQGYDEASPAGDSFLAQVCLAWEEEARAAERHGVRVVSVRIGLVLGHGGALDRLAKVTRWGLGGPLGSGRQWQSWISLTDTVRIILHALDRASLRGPVNAVAPGAVRQRELARALGQVLHRPSFMPTPAFALKLALGDFAAHVLGGRRVVPAALVASGFQFEHADVTAGLQASL
jgi:uncharacterized protein (TIGR01777 family)